MLIAPELLREALMLPPDCELWGDHPLGIRIGVAHADIGPTARLVSARFTKQDGVVRFDGWEEIARSYASGILTEGGDAKQAPGDSLSIPAPKGRRP